MSILRKLVAVAVLPLALVALAEDDDDSAPEKDDDGEQTAEKSSAPEAGFAPYQTILDRKPFGPEPANFDPDAPPGSAAAAQGGGAAEDAEAERSAEEQQIVSSVRVSVLNVTPSGAVAVGFTDSSTQPPANYYLKVGEKRDAWEVKDADPSEQTVVLLKNGIEATLKVGEGVAADGNGKKKRPGPSPMRPVAQNNQAGKGGHVSAMERLRARRMRSAEDLKAEEERREAAAAEAKKNAAQAAAEREQQREALMQIQEELRRQREEREQREAQEKQQDGQQEVQQGEANDT